MANKTTEPVVRVERYGAVTLEDPTSDAMRRERCMCLTCDRLRPGRPDNCVMAQTFFEACQGHGMAMAITRCAEYVGPRSPSTEERDEP